MDFDSKKILQRMDKEEDEKNAALNAERDKDNED